MDGRKIIPVLLLILAYGLYNVRMWFVAEEEEDATTTEAKEVERDVVKLDAKVLEIVANDTQDQRVQKVKKRTFVRIKDACSVLDVFTKKPPRRCKEDMRKELRTDSSAVTMIGITVFLLVLIVNAVLDVLKVKEEERARLKQNPRRRAKTISG
ncbi:hypothetical protein EVAR_91606_1 [Eumeta japonica]|uniref:Uncharacterized protein n=1 Tax=Eumeta variegata TaxID=151549 RepID=A0A4C1UWP6_EUMVA|nr:hypothetical protein EVAR_91606_1 [Eumeta japonica]